MVNFKGFFISAFILVSSAHVLAASDLDVMEKAREQFAKGQLNQAIETYSKISASSDFWLESLEERAWSHTRLGQYEKALADLQSISSKMFSSQVGPETYMLSAFVSLKICAYKDVVKKIDTFKARMLPRIEALQTIIDKPVNSEFWQLGDLIKKNKLSMASLGSQAESYPRYFFRDKVLIDQLNAGQKQKAEQRLKALAEQDLEEISLNLKKMKIIDVEVIQKVLLADKLESKNKKLEFDQVNRNKQLIFPVTDDEVWVDEVGHYQVKADKCPYDSRKTL